MSEPIRIKDLKMQWLATVDAGKQLELYSERDDLPYPIATIVADDEEQLFLEIHVDGKCLQVSVVQILKAFVLAQNDVHSEKWHEQNTYPDVEKT